MLRDKVFGPVEKAREQRLAEKVKARLKQQKGEEDVEDMEVDKEEANKPKVSTSGWRGARNDDYKKKNSTKSRKQLVFKKKMKSKK